MENPSPGILILGGGVAGMSAALALKNQDVVVHLVEKQNSLGGHAASWACMATQTCQNCGACLSIEMADQIKNLVKNQDNILIHLSSQVTSLKKTSQGVEAVLTSGESFKAAKVIMATGFTPFDPGQIQSYHTGTQKKVITTAQLNTLIREERLEEVTGPSPRIAFLQCVGSRNREQNRDYCSQVCCKISLRHAKKLIHLVPDAQISLFYMDLQIIGKEVRETANQLSSDIQLIQGVPAEILENPETNGLTMIIEDPETMARTSREFDLVVLSVGMTPAEDAEITNDLLGSRPNAWGFFNTMEAQLGEDLYIAGCAKGPRDILTSKQDGLIAGAQALKALKQTQVPKITIIGDGPQAAAVAAAMADHAFPAALLGSTNILAVNGSAGGFSIRYDLGGSKKNMECSAIIVAPQVTNQSNTHEFDGAMDLDDFTALSPKECPDNALILLDFFGPEFKAQTRQALMAAMAASKTGKEIYILMNKMLVHGAQGQQLYDRARKTGVRFLRYTTPNDIQIQPHSQKRDTKFQIIVKETTLPGQDLVLDCDCLVLPPTIKPAPGFSKIADLLNLDLDREGFLQPANVRHRLVQSLRKGIFFAGPCHDETDDQDLALEIQAIAASLETEGGVQESQVTINEKLCAKCLTCYRICPHGAIILNEKSRPQIMGDACFSCQLCVSNCPAYAIESPGFTNDQLAEQAQAGQTLVFACQRSGGLSADTLPENTKLISIPCACRISSDMILKALVKDTGEIGADQIIVSGCHEGNCQSQEGSQIARQGVERVLKSPGIPAGKVIWQSVAANEPHIFARMMSNARLLDKPVDKPVENQ